MKHIPLVLLIVLLSIMGIIVFIGTQTTLTLPEPSEDTVVQPAPPVVTNLDDLTVVAIEHATMRLDWAGTTIYTDPVGGADAFVGQPAPGIILLTDVHGDHLSTSTLAGLVATDTVLIAPEAVFDRLPQPIQAQTTVLANGSTTVVRDVTVEAVPMYNLPESSESYHTRGRGNGYVLERAGIRVYVAGDTSDTSEMRALAGIDIAFIPMNLPYTMSVETAADAVLAFAPRRIYPYHYRGPDGLSDVALFKTLVAAGNPDIDVVLLDWYPLAPVDIDSGVATSSEVR